MVTKGLSKVRGALVAALVLAAILLMLAAASADAAFPGQDGDIAFSRDNFRQGTSGIFKVAPEGGAQERIGPEYGYSPSWSADGKRPVFVGYSGKDRMEFDQDIYVMNADGTGLERVTRNRAFEDSPSFFPDGQRIAFTSIRFTGQDGPVARAAGSQEDGAFTPESLTPESLARGASEPKETSAAMPEENIEVSVINADGTEREDLTAGPAYDVLPAFSPSGDRIVFSKVTFDGRTERSELFVMDSGGANKEQITDTPRAFEYGADWQPVFLGATPQSGLN